MNSEITHEFPGSIMQEKFIDSTYKLLFHHGFLSRRALVGASFCRDELCTSILNSISKTWDKTNVFSFDGLAGLPLGGATMFNAMLSHVPYTDQSEKEKLIVLYGFSHISVNDSSWAREGMRPGTDKVHACGALHALLKSYETNAQNSNTIDLEDIEFSLLKKHMPPNLINLKDSDVLSKTTKLAAHAIFNIYRSFFNANRFPNYNIKYALCVGTQIHVSNNLTYILPHHFGIYNSKNSDNIELLEDLKKEISENNSNIPSFYREISNY